MPVRVVKVGGSLFDLPDLPRRLNQWLGQQPPSVNVLIAGGGKWADLIRAEYARGTVSDEAAHWQCIEAMQITAQLLRAAVSDALLVRDCDQLLRLTEPNTWPAPIVFDARQFLDRVEPSLAGPPLPHDWTATSDSIAARVAEWLGADELVLLKSMLPEGVTTLATASHEQIVDEHFSTAACPIARVRCVNLRADAMPEFELRV